MKIEFDVVSARIHHIVFGFNKAIRGLEITDNGAQVAFEIRRFSAPGWDVRTYQFTAGIEPKRHVTLEIWARAGYLSPSGPRILFPGARPQPLRAFVDDELVAASAHQPTGLIDRPLHVTL